jgi:hypothetical protein
MLIKHQELVEIGKGLKHYSIYYDTEYGDVFEEREGALFLIASKNEFHSLIRKLIVIDQKFRGWKKKKRT